MDKQDVIDEVEFAKQDRMQSLRFATTVLARDDDAIGRESRQRRDLLGSEIGVGHERHTTAARLDFARERQQFLVRTDILALELELEPRQLRRCDAAHECLGEVRVNHFERWLTAGRRPTRESLGAHALLDKALRRRVGPQRAKGAQPLRELEEHIRRSQRLAPDERVEYVERQHVVLTGGKDPTQRAHTTICGDRHIHIHPGLG